MSGYFNDFPLINVPGAGLVKNIIARPKINSHEQSLIDYNLTAFMRPDQLAQIYYEDDTLDWSIYVANDIIDPYYDYFMNDDVFNKMIIAKYRSLDIAAQTIVMWMSNWRDDTAPALTPSQYASLPTDVISFYDANALGGKTVVNYTRKRKTVYKTTNLIVTYLLATPLVLTPGTVVTLGTFQGIGTVVSTNGNYVTVQHVINTYNVTTLNNIVCTVIQTTQSISNTQAPYFKPVSAYDLAYSLNESRRSIKLIPPGQAETTRQELKRVLA